jgi:hypothetical protein
VKRGDQAGMIPDREELCDDKNDQSGEKLHNVVKSFDGAKISGVKWWILPVMTGEIL